MGAGLWFWLIYVICVLFGLWADWPNDNNYRPLGSRVVVFVLLGLLGWSVFGPPLK
jgi:tellurite resistance protein TehA-like permease